MASRNIVAKRTARRGRGSGGKRRGVAPEANRKVGTREQLLETAGQVFSEKGYDAATGKEICERSGANAAAVVYHFGGMENLYREVLQAARSQLVPSEELQAAVAAETGPKAKLTAFIRLLVRRLAGPASSTWAVRLISREMISPNPIFDEMRNKEMRARAAILREIVSQLAGLPPEHPRVALSCVNIMAPIGILLLINPRRLEKTFPILSFGPEDVEATTRHMVEFAMGGLAAVGREAGAGHQNAT